ncbi:MAG: hypothetical protein LBU57_02080 [Dysgonamonadaceae bacterium]|jgi:outer membrane murein-binding lipoprotein Lpp|nr:hypothetical protein [Dysgonamonadaceae bacterium]
MKKLVLFATIFAAVALTACSNQKKEEAPAAETEQVETPAPATEEEAAPVDTTVTEAPAEAPVQ